MHRARPTPRRAAQLAAALAAAAALSGAALAAGGAPGAAPSPRAEAAGSASAGRLTGGGPEWRPLGGGRFLIGRSALGRPIVAARVGPSGAAIRLLVVGSIHGGERAGIGATRRLRGVRPPPGVALWLVDELNPDGARAGTRQNANGVDLNRNFPVDWRGGGRPFDTHYPGPAPLSEPESRVAAALVERVRPRVTVWNHQAARMVVRSGGDLSLQRLYARRSALRLGRLGPYTGTAVAWQTRRFRGDTAFVVELPGGPLGADGARRHARAVLALGGAIAPVRTIARPVPFDERRREETRAYARRHYGIDDWRLRRPRVIVEHLTAGDSFGSAWSTFAADVPDVELGELPGVCAHYVVDLDGAVYALVSTRIICRHTVGLNHVAIGIEHVGRSDAQLMSDGRQLAASLRLTRTLQGRFGIRTSHVIGHNESLSSPYRLERVARLRRQTHGDLRRPTMRRYRRLLDRLAAPASLR